MDALTVVGLGLKFVAQHWDSIALFGGLIVKVLFDKSNQYDKEAAQKQAFNMAIDAVKLMAKEQLDNKEKRETAVKMVLEALPTNAKKHVDEQLAIILVERAWSLIKPTLN